VRLATLEPWAGGCVGYPEERCHEFYIELRELVPRAPDRWEAGKVRWLSAGCARKTEVFAAAMPPKARHTNLSLRFAASGMSQLLRPDACRRVSLAPQPAWLTSGAWSDTGILLADSLHGQLLHYDLDGALRQVFLSPVVGSEGPLRVEQLIVSPDGAPVVQASGRLIWLDGRYRPTRQVELTGRRGSHGVLQAVYQLTLVSPNEAFVVGDLQQTNENWIRGVIHVRLRAGGKLESVHRIAPLDPYFDLYRLGNPYLASVGGRAYFVDLREPASLNILATGREPKRRLAILSSSGPSARMARRADLGEPEATTALYRALEESASPAGLYGFRGFLYLLTRRPGQEGKTSWTLTRLDPADGKELYSVSLPTSAPHLTVIPGEHHWALVEKGPVERWGRQTISTAVFVPTEWIEGAGNASPLDCGGTEKDLFATSN